MKKHLKAKSEAEQKHKRDSGSHQKHKKHKHRKEAKVRKPEPFLLDGAYELTTTF